MFPARLFAPRLFPPRLFPKVGADPALNLAKAIEIHFARTLADAFPGGLGEYLAPEHKPLPWVVWRADGEGRGEDRPDGTIWTWLVTFEVWAPTRHAARALTLRLRAAFRDFRPTLLEGRLRTGFRPRDFGPAPQEMKGIQPAGTTLWIQGTTFTVRIFEPES